MNPRKPNNSSFQDDDLVCYCQEVTYKDIVTVIDQGAHTVEEITLACDAGLACGTCIEDLEIILEEYLNNNQAIERKR